LLGLNASLHAAVRERSDCRVPSSSIAGATSGSAPPPMPGTPSATS
jgi:hypothetical protein